MCGIVGFAGKRGNTELLVEGLLSLEYRGYDSAGVAALTDGAICTVKRTGKVEMLKKALDEKPLLESSAGIGHTRWATHGVPNEENAHPHLSNDRRFAVVHNGIIENYLDLKAELEADGITFLSETDTEVIPNLISKYYNGDLLYAVRLAVKRLKGSFAIAVLCEDFPEKVVAAKSFSPLVFGFSESFGFIASDVSALLPYTEEAIFLEDGEMALVSQNSAEIYTFDGVQVEKKPKRLDIKQKIADKGDFEHFMLKEIYDQPEAITTALNGRLAPDGVRLSGLDQERIRRIKRVQLIACGSAHFAGAAGKFAFEELTHLPTENEIASEYRYKEPLADADTLAVFISQSGETADTLAALSVARNQGAYTVAVVNVEESALASAADVVIYTRAGSEVAVATTKGYTTQLICLLLLAVRTAELKGAPMDRELLNQISKIPDIIDMCLDLSETTNLLAGECYTAKDIYFIGRNIDLASAYEAALKLKEISYIHSEAYGAGELKHGSISLIEKGTPVIAVAGSGRLYDKLLGNLKEVKARGGRVFLLGKENTELKQVAEIFLPIPELHPLLSPIVQAIPLQLFAYHCAKRLDRDIDKPRNLAKSVTVE